MNNSLPEIDHYGNPIPKGSIFFKIPTKIGEIVSASTSYSEGQKPMTQKQRFLSYFIYILVALVIGAVIILIGRVSNPIWITIWLFIPSAISLLIANNAAKLKATCNYIGTNGFAQFSFINSPEINLSGFEVCFDNVTDLLKGSTVRKMNYTYQGTDYFFLWLRDGKVVHKLESTHQNKKNEPDKYPFDYFFLSLAVNQWTKKLVEKIPEKIQQDGFLSFDLIVFKDNQWINVKHIRLGIGFIEFIYSDSVIRYNRDEIKKVYFQNGSLFIEHNNYEKKFFGLKEKGNKNEIPLSNLSNQAYFFHAFENLMGYNL